MKTLVTERANARAARDRLTATLAQLRHRTDPAVVIAERTDAARRVATVIIETSRTKANARPWLIALVATAIGIGFAAQERISARRQPTMRTRVERREAGE